MSNGEATQVASPFLRHCPFSTAFAQFIPDLIRTGVRE
jgi:hypothetical protein